MHRLYVYSVHAVRKAQTLSSPIILPPLSVSATYLILTYLKIGIPRAH